MHKGQTLQDMLSEVVRQTESKRDFIADTKETLRMVQMPHYDDGVAIVLLRQGNPTNELQRFAITEHCHRQIAARLKIPFKYYMRLLKDHKDLVIENVNTLFEREPETRLIRTLDGKARAFLSNAYRRVDNDEILEATLPVIRGDFDTTILNTNVNENRMRFKCLFNGDEHQTVIGKAPNGGDDVVHAGFEMGNSEVGGGSFYIRGFFYRSFCLNGCVFGAEETMSMRQIHVGSRVDIPEGFELSEETRRKEDELIITAAKDVLTSLSSPEFTRKMGDRLRALKETPNAKNPEAVIEAIAKEVTLKDSERSKALEAFIREQDYSQWGAVNAVTNVANHVDDYERASELEEIGGKIIQMNFRRWQSIANLERVAA